MSSQRTQIIFFGNGRLADSALEVLARECEVIFHARTREDLAEAVEMKRRVPEAHGVLASYGVLIREEALREFEPEGILNIHPSLLPKYRGASPIESAILAGDDDFSVSVMKLTKKMDAGPIYYQTTLAELPLEKDAIYKALASTGAEWLVAHLGNLGVPKEQDEAKATFTEKLTKEMGVLRPERKPASRILREIVAYQGFPKPKYAFFGISCIVRAAHLLEQGETAVLAIPCADGQIVAVDSIQPEGRKVMDAQSFVNGYGR